MTNFDVAVGELSRQRLRLADGLIFAPQVHGGDVCFHLEDPYRSKFYRLGIEEYTFISLLDGQRSFAEALSLTVQALGARAIGEAEALGICDWLIKEGLAKCDAMQAPPPSATHNPWWKQLNPLWMKLPLMRPAAWLDRALPWLGWLYSLPAAVAWVALCATAAATVATHWERFTQSSQGILAPDNWIWLGATWLVLKIVHELSHALVCRKYGGDVREMGVVLMLLAPLAYVDVTASWRFRSRWQRIHTAAAGMYVELLLAAAAVFWWSRTTSPLVGHLLYNVIFMASVTTLLFNANPLMRFDGYYILSDLAGVPNLYSLGARYVLGLGRRLLFGISSPLPIRGARGILVRLYGPVACAWRLIVSVTLVLAASVMFHGAGLALAIAAVAAWIGRPAAACLHWLREDARVDRGSFVRCMVVVTLMSVGGGLAMFSLPWPGNVGCYGVVEYSDYAVVRCSAGAFVRALPIANGAYVEQGQVLAELRNEALATECQELESALRKSQAKRRIHVDKKEIAAAQIETMQGEALAKHLQEKRRQLEQLVVRAPLRGRVMARNLELKQDTFLAEGDELLTVADDQRQELQIAIPHEDVESVVRWVGCEVAVRLPSRGAFVGRLTRVGPRAVTTPLHQGLCAPNGGPLAAALESSKPDHAQYRLSEPHFTGYVELPRECRDVPSGEVGVAFFRPSSTSLAEELIGRVRSWLRRQLANWARR